MEWIIAANHNLYNHVKAFNELPYIDWKQHYNFEIGDKVYIYSSKPDFKIEFCAEVIRVDIPSKEALNDMAYWKDPNEYYKGRKHDRFFRLRLLHYFHNGISLEEMRNNGLNGNIQGARKLMDELGNYTQLGNFLNFKLNYQSEYEEDYEFLNRPRINSVEDWCLIIRNELENKSFNFINVLLEIYNSPNRVVFCKDLELKMGINGLNLRVGEFRDRIKKIPNIHFNEQLRKDTGTDRAWNIPFKSSEYINNLPENKGKFCWILREEVADALERVIPNIVKQTRILFCNIAYMSKYDGDLSDKPVNGGQYIKDTGDAIERYNFYICNDNKVRGFVETKYIGGYQTGGKPKQIRIENIDQNYKNKDKIDDVTVIFCAKSPLINKTVIVGWYQNATVYRNRQKFSTRDFNITADANDVVLLDEEKRDYIIPRAKGDNAGIGQSQVWYANNNLEAKKIAADAFEYISKNKNSSLNAKVFKKAKSEVSKKNSFVVKENKMIDIHSKLKLSESNFIEKDEYSYSKDLLLRPDYIVKNETKIYKRNRDIAINALGIAGFKCEIDNNHKTFIRKNNNIPYTESHHLIPMCAQADFEYSLDIEENIVSLCSHCHNEIHYGVRAEELITELYHQRKELLESKNIFITLEQLLSYY